MKKETVRLRIRMSEEEKERLEHNAAVCGLTQAEYVRQVCKGRQAKPLPDPLFWKLMEELYHLHDTLQKLAVYSPEADEECSRLRELILRLTEVT